VEEINPENKDEASEYIKKWCKAKDCREHEMLEEEKKAVIYCMKHFSELGLFGIYIRIDGDIQALSVWEPLNRETAVIHFEKACRNTTAYTLQ